MTALLTILFNTDRFLRKQYELFSKHLDGQFIVLDNSTDSAVSININDFCRARNIRYIRTQFNERDSSRSHGLACNEAYKILKDYDIIGYFDHDLFPIADVNISELMKDKVIAGVPQFREEITYFWAGFVIINNNLIDRNAVDFMPSPGLDTGGEIHRIMKHLPQSSYHFFAERPNDELTKISFDIEAKEPCFIHFRNGSNWANEPNYEERINRLMGLL